MPVILSGHGTRVTNSRQPGQVVVIDNGGRLDEGCVGDLAALEAQHCWSGAIEE
ncbi:MAG TPA: hypothetical protein VFA61_09310 [Candidatus Udaeobacter sp.]|nr:hypothetical protein [Candidatus Udaeobacter sp.]